MVDQGITMALNGKKYLHMKVLVTVKQSITMAIRYKQENDINSTMYVDADSYLCWYYMCSCCKKSLLGILVKMFSLKD